jgi:FkbM family methyltransferase
MKEILKKMIPKAWLPLARRLYASLHRGAPDVLPGYQNTENISALRCVVSYNKYGGYCVPESARHRPAAKAILGAEVYEPQTLAYMIANCGNRDIIHAGTFFGDFLPALSAALHPGALLWAFEPNHENYCCANITIALNYSQNIRLANMGLGARGEQLFVQTRDSDGVSLGGASRIVGINDSCESNDAVQVVAIDDVVPSDRSIGILQLDVEGYEKEALKGALATIRRCLPILILEVWPGSTLLASSWFSENILSLGYEKHAVLHGNVVLLAGEKWKEGRKDEE